MSVALFILAVLLVALFWRQIVASAAPSALEASPADLVGEAGKDSFPCSDPPPWTLGMTRPDH